MNTEDSEVLVPSLSLRDFLAVLSRRRSTAFITFVAVLAAVILMTLLTKPQYLASTTVILEDQSKSSSSSGDLEAIFNTQTNLEIETQMQLVTSPLILNSVYKEAKINPNSVDLTATRVGTSRAILLTGVSQSKEGVEKFMAALPEVYRDNRSNDRLREVRAQLNFATQDLKTQTQKLQDTERALTDFKNSKGIVDVDSEANNAIAALSQSKASLDSARANASSLQAQIAALQSELSGLPPFINTPVTTTNPQIELLRNQLADLKSERNRLSFLYKDNADPMRQNAAKIKDLERRISNTPPTITTNSRTPNPAVVDTRNKIASVRADLQAQQAAIGELQKQIAAQEQGLKGFTQTQREGAQLNRQLESTRKAVQDGGANVRDLTVRSNALGAASAPVTTIAPSGSAEKIAPQPKRSLILGVFLGALLACAAALIHDALDDRVRDEEEARQLLGAPILGYFPRLSGDDQNQIINLENPDRLMLESFRALRSNVQFALVNTQGKKLQITSAVPSEGKSYVTSNLAITMALDGRRVVLVDADLHRPTMHERLGGKRQPGLTNVLVGEVALKDALQQTHVPGLRLLSAGALPPNPAELLNSPAMDAVLRELEADADLVIIDTPPLLATADSQLLAAKVDGVVFVMQMGSVARSGTQRAFELLRQAHANLIGIVFNKVNNGKGALSYEYYSGYYSLEQGSENEKLLDSDGSGPRSLKTNLAATPNGTSPENNGHGASNGAAQTLEAQSVETGEDPFGRAPKEN